MLDYIIFGVIVYLGCGVIVSRWTSRQNPNIANWYLGLVMWTWGLWLLGALFVRLFLSTPGALIRPADDT